MTKEGSARKFLCATAMAAACAGIQELVGRGRLDQGDGQAKGQSSVFSWCGLGYFFSATGC
jgi:hypothetical protein